ncbi:MAG TPA: hypothetical protein DEF47_18395 [Herpetosiphon sp.]|uniref:Protein glutaminase domain-containing protein n=1 Tax=Herpetosiphon aurantiacus (strain ATCC 23779 / DSM 785 / 114-95) TaxID=316274 RepID=A9B560_HERA2|nr:protein-glutamine glutaminase family protein [Herpetosiphon sp.]ABX06197.1 hypothetical protein Haur_3561 [Herpetosiphon aurantiacus DSM 785]HBW51863.1 hypothetical protein [Herpetosiphon sp.]
MQVNQDGSVSYADATLIFDDMANEADIPFNFKDDGCYARSYLMGNRIVERYGINPDDMFKVTILDRSPSDSNPTLTVPTDKMYPGFSSEDGTVNWTWHIAPAIKVQTPNGVEIMVIDPSLSTHPLSVDQWEALMNDPQSNVEIKDHSWYTPWDQVTPENKPFFDDHAQKTMEEYMRYCQEAGYCQ